jgi:WD40 repeat protein
MGQAKRLIDSGNLLQAIALLDQYAAHDQEDDAADGMPRRDIAPPQTDHRGFEWHYLKKLCQRDHRQLTGHAAAINCLRYSRDGNFLASGDDAGAVRIWRLDSNGEPITLDAHRHAVVDVAFSSNGQVLASIGADRGCRVWEISSGRELAELRTNLNPLVSPQLTSVDLSSDGSQCATGDSQGQVALWQVATGEKRRVEDAQSRPGPCYVAFSPDDATLLVGGKGQNARAFDVTTTERVAQSPTLAGPVTRVCAAHTPGCFAAGDLFGCVYLFKRDGDKLTCQAPLTILSGRVRDLSFSVDGQAVVAVAESGAAVAMDINDGRTRSKLEAVERSARAIAAHVGAERPSIAWNTPSHAVDVYAFPKPREYDRIATADSPNWLDLSPDDHTLAVAFGNKSYVDVIDTAADRGSDPQQDQSLERTPEQTNPPPSKQSIARFSDHRGPLASVCFSRDGRWLLTADGVGFVAVRDLTTDAAEVAPRTHEFGWANSVATVFAGPENAVYAGGLEGKLRVWLPGTSKVATLQGGHGPLPVLCVAATRDGRRVASGCFDGTLAIWDTSDQKLLTKVSAHRHQINQIAIDPTGEVVATTSLDSTVRLWNLADGRELATLPCERPSWGVAFSADGRTLATSHDMGEPGTSYLQLWNVTTRRELYRLPAPDVRRWTALRFASDGGRLYATGGNGDTAGIYCWSTVASPAHSPVTQHADAKRASGKASP